MNDADRFQFLPDEILFKSYVQRAIDHLSIVRYPGYIIDDDYCPDQFFGKSMAELLAFAKDMMPETGENKNLGYLPFFIYVACSADDSHTRIVNFVIPPGSDYVTPENLTAAETRYPEIHGSFPPPTKELLTEIWYRYTLNLDGTLVHTPNKYYIAKLFDQYLDSTTTVKYTYSFTWVGTDVFNNGYKTRALYPLFNIKTFENGALIREVDTDGNQRDFLGEFGWSCRVDDNKNVIWSSKSAKVRFEIHSTVTFRYKYVVMYKTDSNREDYGGGPYNLAKNSYSVLYESPDWCTGDSIWEYEFSPGSQPSSTDDSWTVRMYYPTVIITIDYPDRLKEYYEELIERN